MRAIKNLPFRITLLSAFAVAGMLPALAPAVAQTAATPQQIQGLIAHGQENAALSDLQVIMQSHPQSGVAWYLTAEAQDASGNEAAARGALAKADQYAPGLPFAQPDDVAALRTHLSNTAAPAQPAYTPPARHFSPFMVIGGIVVLFLLFRMFVRSRRRMMPGYPMNPGNPVGPYGPGGMPYGGGGMMGGGMMGGGGIGGSLLGGLAAGAGFAGGERIIDGMMGGNQGGQNNDPNGNIDRNIDPGAPARDDGLMGSPGWGDNSGGIDNSGTIDSGGDSGGGFDPGNSW